MSRVFFTDRDLGKQFPEILAAAGLSVERHADHFKPDCPDDEWLEVVGKKGWVAISHDRRIRYKPNELDAVVRHRVVLLVVIGKTSFANLARNFVATAPAVFEFLDAHAAPLIAKVYRPIPSELAKNTNTSGSVLLWYPK